MIAMCASLGICARYVSGHLLGEGASHAWTEVFDPARQLVVAIHPTIDGAPISGTSPPPLARSTTMSLPRAAPTPAAGVAGTLRVEKAVRLVELA